MTGMGKTFIYDRMRDGTPKQIQLGSRSVVWNEQEVTWDGRADGIQMTQFGESLGMATSVLNSLV